MDLNLKKQVEEILKTDPDSRNSDITLMLELWRRFYPQRIRRIDGVEMIALGSLYDIAREDGIKRIRAQFNEGGKYLPTSPEVLKQRRIEENKAREFLGYSPIKELQANKLL